jgi:hypothetical protein
VRARGVGVRVIVVVRVIVIVRVVVTGTHGAWRSLIQSSSIGTAPSPR